MSHNADPMGPTDELLGINELNHTLMDDDPSDPLPNDTDDPFPSDDFADTPPLTRESLQSLATIQVNLRAGRDPRAITLSMPTRDQWIARQRRRPIEIIQLSRGMSENKVRESREEDLRIYSLIKSPDSPSLDKYESSVILNNLAKANTLSVKPEAEGYRIRIETVAGVFAPLLKIPSVRDWQIYTETRARVISGKHTEVYINLAAGERLFNETVIDWDRSDLPLIPILWKAAAVTALIEEVEGSFLGSGDVSSNADAPEDLFRTRP